MKHHPPDNLEIEENKTKHLPTHLTSDICMLTISKEATFHVIQLLHNFSLIQTSLTLVFTLFWKSLIDIIGNFFLNINSAVEG